LDLAALPCRLPIAFVAPRVNKRTWLWIVTSP
jgi:hypothetical protein